MRALFMYDVRWFFLLCCYFVVLVLCFFGCSQHAWSLIDCIFIVSVDGQMSGICSKLNFMLVRLMRLYMSTQQEHLMLHDSDLPCEAPGQPYFSSPVGFFKQWPPWFCRRRGAAGWPAHAEPANHAMSHRRLNHEPAPEKPSSPNALPQRSKQFLGTYPDRLDFSAPKLPQSAEGGRRRCPECETPPSVREVQKEHEPNVPNPSAFAVASFSCIESTTMKTFTW